MEREESPQHVQSCEAGCRAVGSDSGPRARGLVTTTIVRSESSNAAVFGGPSHLCDRALLRVAEVTTGATLSIQGDAGVLLRGRT